MIKLLQIISTIIVIGVAPITCGNYVTQNGFLSTFMTEQSLSIMGSILAIYIAAASSFLAIIMSHEKEANVTIFKNTSLELKHNILCIIVVFIFHFGLMVWTPKEIEPKSFTEGLLMSAKTFTFILYIYMLYELSNVLFGIRETLNRHRKQ